MSPTDITPEDSVVPVFIKAEPKIAPTLPPIPGLEEREVLREAGIQKFMGLGLTREEAEAFGKS